MSSPSSLSSGSAESRIENMVGCVFESGQRSPNYISDTALHTSKESKFSHETILKKENKG